MVNTVMDSHRPGASGLLSTEEKDLKVVFAHKDYITDVYYGFSVEEHLARLGCLDNYDYDIRQINAVPLEITEEKAEKVFDLAFFNKTCSVEEAKKIIEQQGRCLVNYHEGLAFANIYRQENLKHPVAAIEALFQVPRHGNHALVIERDDEEGAMRLGLKMLRLKILPRYAHVVILNETIHPIM